MPEGVIFGLLIIVLPVRLRSAWRLRSSAVSNGWPAALLPAEGLDDCLFGLLYRGAVGVIVVQLGVNGFGLFHVFQAA